MGRNWRRPKGRPHVFSTGERLRVVELYQKGYSYGQIVEILDISKTTIWRLLKGHTTLTANWDDQPKESLSPLPDELR